MIFYIKHMSKNEKGIHTKTQVISQTLGRVDKQKPSSISKHVLTYVKRKLQGIGD